MLHTIPLDTIFGVTRFAKWTRVIVQLLSQIQEAQEEAFAFCEAASKVIAYSSLVRALAFWN